MRRYSRAAFVPALLCAMILGPACGKERPRRWYNLEKALKEPEKVRSLSISFRFKDDLSPILRLRNLQELRFQFSHMPRGKFKGFVPPSGLESLPDLRLLKLPQISPAHASRIIAPLKNLEELKIHYCHLGECSAPLPPKIGSLHELDLTPLRKLRKLNLGFSGHRVRIRGLNRLTELKLLRMRNNRATKLPPDLGELPGLEKLWISFFEAVRFPPESLSRLGRLRDLYLFGLPLERLPRDFGRLRSLRSLDISNGRLRVLPDSFGQLGELEFLTLKGNELERLPPGFQELSSVRRVNLRANRLKEFPRELTGLSGLEHLDLSHNLIRALPASIAGLRKLKQLELDCNLLQTLPEELDRLTNLRGLKLNLNEFRDFPSVVARLPELRQFSISGNRIRALPPGFGELELIKRWPRYYYINALSAPAGNDGDRTDGRKSFEGRTLSLQSRAAARRPSVEKHCVLFR